MENIKTESSTKLEEEKKEDAHQKIQQSNESKYMENFSIMWIFYRCHLYVLLRYPHLLDINVRHQDIFEHLNSFDSFFVIKSYTEEDIHKAIKYNIWSSSANGNSVLNQAYKASRLMSASVYLFFSCNGSGRFSGIARMASPLSENKAFIYWTTDNKYRGIFNLEWIFIKDVPFKAFRDIFIEDQNGLTQPIVHSRNLQKVEYPIGKDFVEKFSYYWHTHSILEHFEYYDMRQKNYERMSHDD